MHQFAQFFQPANLTPDERLNLERLQQWESFFLTEEDLEASVTTLLDGARPFLQSQLPQVGADVHPGDIDDEIAIARASIHPWVRSYAAHVEEMADRFNDRMHLIEAGEDPERYHALI